MAKTEIRMTGSGGQGVIMGTIINTNFFILYTFYNYNINC